MGSCLSISDSTSACGDPLPLSSPYDGHGGNGIGKRKRRLPEKSSSSFDDTVEMQLHRVPGRMFLNGSTQVASLYCMQGGKGINQDSMLVWENFCSREDTILVGVFDGHGPFGHMVAKKVRDSFPLKLSAQWDLHRNNKDGLGDLISSMRSYESKESGLRLVGEKSIAANDELDGKNTFVTLKESFLKACKVMDKELKLHPDIDCFCSGTTAVTLVKKGQDLVIGNVGDSRAVLGTRDHDDSLIAVQLTTDLKPNLPRESERIRLCKGRVFALKNEPGVSRVWLPNADSPGLAMARAFGDFCLKDFGVISVPDVSYRRLTEKDEFVVLATDGVWDVLSNQEVVGIVASAPRSSAARILVESAVQAWRTKLPTSKVDDCSVVCLFFDSDLDSKTAYTIGKLIPEASIERSDIGSRVSAAPKTALDCCSEQSPLVRDKGIGVEAEQQQQ